MSIVSTIKAERDRYVAFFESAVARARSENPESASELLIDVNADHIPYPYRYLRVDLMQKRTDGAPLALEFWLDPDEAAQGRGFDLGPVKVELHPFTWCAVQIGFDRPLRDEREIAEFLTKWLDVDDAAHARGEDLSGAIHSATCIESNGSFWFLTIDFGTAPADAMLDLLDLIVNGDATRVIVTSQPSKPS